MSLYRRALLLALLEDSAALTVLTACSVSIEELRGDLVEFIDSTTPLLGEEEDGRDTQPTLGFQRVLQRAFFMFRARVSASYWRQYSGGYFLRARVPGGLFLKKSGCLPTRCRQLYYPRYCKDDDAEDEGDRAGSEASEEAPEAAEQPLDTFATNLNEEARTGQIDPLIGRLSEVERVAQILARRRKNNPLLVGESGVGKTAIAEGLAKKIVDGDVPEILKDAVVYSLDLGALLAGTKYRGDFEKRFKGLLANLKERDHAILFIDEIHTIHWGGRGIRWCYGRIQPA